MLTVPVIDGGRQCHQLAPDGRWLHRPAALGRIGTARRATNVGQHLVAPIRQEGRNIVACVRWARAPRVSGMFAAVGGQHFCDRDLSEITFADGWLVFGRDVRPELFFSSCAIAFAAACASKIRPVPDAPDGFGTGTKVPNGAAKVLKLCGNKQR